MKRLLFMLWAAAFATEAFARQTPDDRIRGTVVSVHENHLAVLGIDGIVRHVTLTAKTRIVRETAVVKAAEIKTAEHVVVKVVAAKDETGAALVAEEVHLGTVPPVSKPTAGDAGHKHGAAEPRGSPWHVMQDAVAFLTYNKQGGPRGGDDNGEVLSQNWWMGMAQRPAAGGTLQFNLMLSLDPATMGNDGYREIFQVGETLDGLPLIDRQHPHDFLMQAAVVWRVPLPRNYQLTLAGAPVGEPALGPIAFMHRSSAYENPTAPLGHHTFDSTHIAMGVLTAGLARGPFEVESSIFRGREPDEQRWDLMDPGALDSWSVRGWYRPTDALSFQLSHGFLTAPEELEEGNARRTTISGSWMLKRGEDWTSATVAYGRNDKHEKSYNAFLAESTHVMGMNTVYGRAEVVQVETDLLRFGTHVKPAAGKGSSNGEEGLGRIDVVKALTIGGVRRLRDWRGWDLGAGGDVTFYGVPETLAPFHGERPVSFHLFFRIRSPAPMGRMHDMTMTKGMH